MSYPGWEVVIGLEVHVQLKTQSKIFSGAATTYGAEANRQACAIDLGFPGVLPVLNQQAVEMAVKFGLAVGAQIAERCVFARKHYFYPDLPKGYQISQYELPIVAHGHLDISTDGGETSKRIRILRAHLEEDAGKSVHEGFEAASGIDLNRAGTPLIEVVSEPDLRSAGEAVAYLKKLHSLVRYLEICDGNMQEGSFRCDANVSVRPVGQEELGTRTETKNLNSFRFVEKAIEFEIERQIDVLESGGSVDQETRLFDPDKGETRTMRSKEEAMDYRYFPDPDLLPVVCDGAFVSSIRDALPELPEARRTRFMASFGLPAYDADALVAERDLAAYFEALVAALGEDNAKLAANWCLGELTASLNEHNLDVAASAVTPDALAGLLKRVLDNTVSGKIAKDVFAAMWAGEGDADSVIEARGLKQITDSGAIETLVDQVIADSPAQVEQYRSGKDKVFGYFVGQVMKLSKGKANPGEVNRLLKSKL
ncbi:glutamyl-tRNA(Gln) amidotransferase subunit B [Oceanococcus atlanticus]|uniref:Aspartyl/glutamyl-tRNA(Asn/Gln) amidotransferase subunit B n=1 Tax=Oceanococcus atlanticus TaxID=1317117 RepID=A0A1Y1SEF4_9GAMM|nr:Asp-tRNA(Asn)/Glu-tRNA(Gln) amidotransferase subunit GatB [Oceanococcus atlanticus]ORE87349.1 glutamyl-tRNA(Gln) amidotransferase subunit B [Oceanococcus atlanticus]